MGRSLKQRKLKKVRRVKVHRSKPAEKSSKKAMKKWEWWLIGFAFVFAFIWLIFLGKSGNITPDIETTPVPTAQTAGQ